MKLKKVEAAIMSDPPSYNYPVTIDQAHAITGVPKSILRNWERNFGAKNLGITRTEGNRRRYTKASLYLLQSFWIIKKDPRQDFNIGEIKKKMRFA